MAELRETSARGRGGAQGLAWLVGWDALLPKSLAHPWAFFVCLKELQELDSSPKPHFSLVLAGASQEQGAIREDNGFNIHLLWM